MFVWQSVFIVLVTCCIHQCEFTPLDDYVHADDPHFGWNLIRVHDELEFKVYILNFTSQKWFDGNFVLNLMKLSFVLRNIFNSIDMVALFVDCCSS